MSASLLARIVEGTDSVHRRVKLWARERPGETWAGVSAPTRPLVMRATEADVLILACQATRPEELSPEQLDRTITWLTTALQAATLVQDHNIKENTA